MKIRIICFSALVLFAGCSATKVTQIPELVMFVVNDNTGVYMRDYTMSNQIATLNYGDSVLVTGKTWLYLQVKLDSTYGFVKSDTLITRYAFQQYRIKQDAYIAAMRQPLVFKINIEDEKNAWGRAQSFIGRFSSMKLQIVTDYVLQTYNPTEASVRYGYTVTKSPVDNRIEISVECVSGNIFATKEASTNAHMLAYYIATGKLLSEYLSQ